MLVALIVQTIIFGLVVYALTRELRATREGAREERQGLEDRLIAVCKPEALAAVSVPVTNGAVSYVEDEEKADADTTQA